MRTLTLTSKGQVTFRKEILHHLGIRPGEKLAVEKLPDGRIEVRAARSERDIRDVFDVFRRHGSPALSIEDIKEAAEQGWAGEQ